MENKILSIDETIETIYKMRDLINKGAMLEALEICNEINDSIIFLKDFLKGKEKENGRG